MGFAGVLLYVALTLIRPQELIPGLGQYRIMDLAAGVASLGLVFSLLTGGRLSFRAPQLYLCAAFIAWAALSVVLSLRWLGGAWLALQSLSINAFVFFLTAVGGTDMRRLEALRRVVLVSLLTTTAMALAGYYLHWHETQFVMQRVDVTSSMSWFPSSAVEPEDETPPDNEDVPDTEAAPSERPRRLRALGFLNDPNDLAQMLVAAMPLLAPSYRPRRPLRNLLLLGLPGGVFLFAVLLTRSRGGLLSLFVLVGFVVGARFSERTRRILRILMAPLLLIVAGALILYARTDDSAFGRLEAWSEGVQMLKESPLWGVGFGNFLEHHDLVAHNSFVQCFAELGLVGYTLWLALLFGTLSSLSLLRHRDETSLAGWASALRLSLLTFLTGALLLSRTYSPALFLLLGVAVALLATADHEIGRMEGVPVARLALRVGVTEVVSILAVWAAMRLVH